MAAKTPIRTVFNASNVATGLAEFQSGEFLALSHGGIGAALSIGTAGQVLKVNSGASALEFGSAIAIVDIDGATDGSSVTLAASDKFLFSDGGTEKFLLASQIDTYVSATSATLTNKTLTSPAIATITSASTITLDSAGDINIDAGGGDILLKDDGTRFGSFENTSGNLIINSGSTAAMTFSGASVTMAGNATIAGNLTVEGTTTTVDSTTINVQNSFVFEGATADAHETTLTTVDPTADRTISLPNATGTIVLKDSTDTLTNKSIDSDNNTITNIVNADIKAAAGILFSKMADLTASRALVSDGNGDVSVSAVTSTEIGHLDGVSSNIQTQLDATLTSTNGATRAFAIAQAVALG